MVLDSIDIGIWSLNGMPNTEVWGNLYIINNFQHVFMKKMSYLLSNWVFIWRFRPSKVSNTVFSKVVVPCLTPFPVLANGTPKPCSVKSHMWQSCHPVLIGLLLWSWLFSMSAITLFRCLVPGLFLIKQALRNIGWKLKKIIYEFRDGCC